jgi:hypothetical protein
MHSIPDRSEQHKETHDRGWDAANGSRQTFDGVSGRDMTNPFILRNRQG